LFLRYALSQVPGPRVTLGNPATAVQNFTTELSVLPQYLKAILLPHRITLDRNIALRGVSEGFDTAIVLLIALGTVAVYVGLSRTRSVAPCMLLMAVIWML